MQSSGGFVLRAHRGFPDWPEVERRARDLTVPDVSVEIFSQAESPPMEEIESTARLVERAKEAAAELGFELRDAATGF
jgi:pantoate kinase